ncbi:uncharacterized protein LOC132544876 [Ylistrum balloti]|uniref:uncharacterized protein LOC132544876 n=1 Tax=Ylistrum balloti TaxID=509963 RepID=UPI002905C75E|nr:uncharacterized protein LOC132544876 [Ylistrum balloti]
MTMKTMDTSFVCLMLMVAVIPIVTVNGVACYQCNIFKQGTTHLCGGEERVMHNCSACFKSFVRAYLHNQWNRYSYTTAISRYCVRFAQYKRDEGCYVKTANSGYVKQCFCYTDYCNGAASLRPDRTQSALRITLAIGCYILLHIFRQ